MNLTIFTGFDPGSNLEELLRCTPLGLGVVCALVPDSRSVKDMESRLAGLSGDAFLGHRVFTFEGLAYEILSHSGKAPELIGEHTKRALLGEITRSRISKYSEYCNISSFSGFLTLLVSFLRDIRSIPDGESAEDTNSYLRYVAAAYDRRLRMLGKTDHEGMVALALEGDHVERFSSLFHGSFIVDGFYDMTEMQFELLTRLFRLFRRSAVTLLYDAERPELYALPLKILERYQTIGAKVVTVEHKPSNSPEKVLSGFMGGRYSGKSSSGDVQVHTFRSEATEADWICGTVRSLITDGVCEPKDVMIVSRVQPGSGSPIHTAMKHHGIPVEGTIEQPLTQFPLIKLIHKALEASVSADDTIISQVQKSNYTGDVSHSGRFPLQYADDRVWSCMIAESDTPEGFVMSIKRMLERLNIEDNIIAKDREALRHSEIMVYERFIGLLDEFEAIYSPFYRMMKATDFKRLLEQFLENVTVPDSPSAVSGVLVVGAVTARHVNRKVVFLTGLDNTAFPLKHDTFTLHGSKRGRIIRENREREEGLFFYLAGTGSERLYLTFPGIDDEGKDASMSPYLEEICKGIASWCEPEFHHGVPGSAWEEGAVDDRGRAENIMRVLHSNITEAPSILSCIRKRDGFLEQQLSTAIADYVRRIERCGLNLEESDSRKHILGKWSPERVLSVTGLELYLSCPISFFLSRIIGLTVDRYEEEEINALELGSLIHEILAVFYSTRMAQEKRAYFTRSDIHDCKILMKEIVERTITRELVPARRLPPVILLAEKKHILAWMEIFLEKEAEYFEETGFEPAFFEIEFGRSRMKKEPEFAALALEYEGEKVLVGGRIDRIDINSAKNSSIVRIIDYKTGFRNAPISELEEGSALQIPLYLRAAVEFIVPNGTIHDGVYYTLREMEKKGYRDRKTRIPIQGREWEQYIQTASRNAWSAALEIRKGCFPRKPGKCDEYCEFKTLCMSARIGMEKT